MSLIASTITSWLGTVPAVSSAIDTTGAKLIVVTLVSYPADAALVDSEGNTWTALTNVNPGLSMKQWYCINPDTNAAHTFSSVGGGAAAAMIAVQAFNDVVTFLDESQNGAGGVQTSIAPGSVDPTPDDALFVTGMYLEGSDAPTIGSSFTQDETSTLSQTFSIAHKYSNTAENPTWTSFTSGATFGAAAAMAVFTVPPSDPPVITTITLPAGSTGAAYSQTLAHTGGTAPIAWSVISGALPDGLSLNPSTGAITGTPTAIDTFSFTVQATDDLALTDTQALSIEITDPFGTFDVLDMTGMRLENVGWVGAVLRANFGRGFGAQANPGGPEGLHKWFLHSGGVWPDFPDWGLTIEGQNRFAYYWDFFKEHTTGATEIFIIEWRDAFYHASFAEPEISVDKFKNILLYEGGLAINQRRIVGGVYNEDGSIVGGASLATPESVEAFSLTDTEIFGSWEASSDTVDGYEYRIDGGSPVDVGDALEATVDGLDPETEYLLEVRAYFDGSFSAWVAADPVTTLSDLAFAGGTGLLFKDDFTDLAAWTDTTDFTAVANPTFIAFEPSTRTYEPEGASAAAARECGCVYDGGIYYLFHTAVDEYGNLWKTNLSTSPDGITWTRHGVPWFGLQKTEDPDDGYWAGGRSSSQLMKLEGVWYWHIVHASTTYSASVPNEPYFSDCWSTTDPTADDWEFVGDLMGAGAQPYDARSLAWRAGRARPGSRARSRRCRAAAPCGRDPRPRPRSRRSGPRRLRGRDRRPPRPRGPALAGRPRTRPSRRRSAGCARSSRLCPGRRPRRCRVPSPGRSRPWRAPRRRPPSRLHPEGR